MTTDKHINSGGDLAPQIFQSLGRIEGMMQGFQQEQRTQNARLDNHEGRIGTLETSRVADKHTKKGALAVITLVASSVGAAATYLFKGGWH